MIGIISALNAELMEIVENLETEKVIYKNLIFYKAKYIIKMLFWVFVALER